MNQKISSEIMIEMLIQLAPSHFYGKTVANLIGDLGTAISSNIQLNEVLGRCAKQCNFQNTSIISWSDLGKDDKRTLNSFFDYLYFTSPQFIKDAG